MSKILVVDDNSDLADGLRTLLEIEGYDTDVAYSGKEAIDMLKGNQYELAIVDIKMPEINGFKVVSECKDQFLTKYILMTGYRVEQIVSEVRANGSVFAAVVSDDRNRILDSLGKLNDYDVFILAGDSTKICNDAKLYLTSNNLSFADVHGKSDFNNVENIDVMIFNLNSPFIDAVILLDEFNGSIDPDVKIIIVVDSSGDSIENPSFNSFSVSGCLFKPLNPGNVLTILESVC